jgi:hypothetical protein
MGAVVIALAVVVEDVIVCGARGSRQCSKSRYKVVVIQGMEGSVR